MRRTLVALLTLSVIAVLAGSAGAQTYDAGSTGADGALTLPAGTCVGLTCTINVPASGEFNYTTVNIPAGYTLKFKRNTTNTPVVIRASGNVTIGGNIDVSGANGGPMSWATGLGNNGGVGGPGGFDGGAGANGIVSTTGGTGMGPGAGGGGATVDPDGRGGGGAGFAVAGTTAPSSGGTGGSAYGTATLLPLIGGSGGGGGGAPFGSTGGGGGGGGGALLIASNGTINLTGTIFARGGNAAGSSCCPVIPSGGPGSGGAVRLIATTISGTGAINVLGGLQATGSGGSGAASIGRVRVEAYSNTAQYGMNGAKASIITQPTPVVLANTPTLRITAVASVSAPTSPGGLLGTPDVVLPSSTTNPVTVALAASQIPLGTTVQVTVRGQVSAYTSTVSGGLSGTLASSTASVSVTVPTDQPCVISATATFERVASAGEGPSYAEDERIERVRVTATSNGVTYLTYVTASGREIEATAAR